MRTIASTLAVLALVAAPALAGEYNTAVSVGDKAPDFSGIPAYTPTTDEMTSLSLSDINEEVIVVAFLANHCPVVQACEDRMIEFVEDYKGKPVKFVGIGVNTREDDRMPAIKEYTKEKGSNYVYGYDESQATGRQYGATATPQVFVLDKDRNIRYMGLIDDSHNNESRVTKTFLRDAVDAVLAGEEVEVKETRPLGCRIEYNQ